MAKKIKKVREILSSIEFCRFKREEKSKWEWGVLLNHGSLQLLDKYGEKPYSVWDYQANLCVVSVSLINDGMVFELPK